MVGTRPLRHNPLGPCLIPRYLKDFVFLHIDLNTHFHYTGLFFPWHRWYIHAFEQTLKEQCGFRGTVPYWDWSLGLFLLDRNLRCWFELILHLPTDVADMENMTILSDDPVHGMGRWGNASNDDQITTGGWKDFRVSYPVPNGIRRKYTILPFPNATAGPLFPDPTRLSNETLTREKVEGALHDCAAGDFVCFQTHVEGFQNMHGGGHSVLGGGSSHPLNVLALYLLGLLLRHVWKLSD